ncbi:MAG TPA: hypothetical protein VOA78_11805 [Candidatus Dormibacteraeota bacterium]|nr:hypothetical protein [Candidatus Dormibacteraeota bacterium]
MLQITTQKKMPFISVTRLHVRSLRYLPQFAWRTVQIVRQTKRASGLLGGKLLREARNALWTITAWQDEASMNAFRIASAHGAVMPKLLGWCDEASVVHWHQETPELPAWLDAHRRMVNDGRPSKVHHPSPAQLENRIPVPQPGRFELTLKPAPQ